MKQNTIIVKEGRGKPEQQFGMVNVPVYHGSTVLFPTLADFELAERGQYPRDHYGRAGSPTSHNLEEAIARLEGGYKSIALSSGVAAVSTTLLAFLKAGDHLLMIDSVYSPTRIFCDDELKRFGVETTYYDASVSADIEDYFKPDTKAVFIESPGSLTFEVQDIAAITAAAKKRGIVVIADNTWATPLYFKPFEHGIDVSIHAATKYISGHSDLLMGIVTTAEEHYPRLLRSFRHIGACSAPDDCYLAARGLRTLAVRMAKHQENGLALAKWLQGRDEVVKILHPAFEECPGHENWQRYFSGASGLFSVLLKPFAHDKLAAMIDGLELFGVGYSWGGFESLIMPFNPAKIRTASNWEHDGLCLRFHAGLEDIDDLMADLSAGFDRLNG
jgi:cystathionine beta-lyase